MHSRYRGGADESHQAQGGLAEVGDPDQWQKCLTSRVRTKTRRKEKWAGDEEREVRRGDEGVFIEATHSDARDLTTLNPKGWS